METVVNTEKVALTLNLNAVDVPDFIAALRYLRFPVVVENVKKERTKDDTWKEYFADMPAEIGTTEEEFMDFINT